VASRFAVAWYVVPPGARTGLWWWEVFEASGTRSPQSVITGHLTAAPWHGAGLWPIYVQELVGKMASVNAAAVAVARGVVHA
jgi:hypothetical protein